jgi:threonine dehydrogenase-like Zn-dependent dehydrogenase
VDGGTWGGPPSPGGAQAEAIRVPYADVNLVRLPSDVDRDALVPYVLLSDVLPTGHHAAMCGRVTPEATVVVVGDGPVALATVLAVRRLGAEQVMVLARSCQLPFDPIVVNDQRAVVGRPSTVDYS